MIPSFCRNSLSSTGSVKTPNDVQMYVIKCDYGKSREKYPSIKQRDRLHIYHSYIATLFSLCGVNLLDNIWFRVFAETKQHGLLPKQYGVQTYVIKDDRGKSREKFPTLKLVAFFGDIVAFKFTIGNFEGISYCKMS